jgi:crossover junction endodeoxyribonuclease RuvC
MIILGIDPGSRKAGFGVIESVDRRIKYISSGVMRYEHHGVFIDRLGLIYSSLIKIIQEFNPSEVAIESLILVRNVNSMAKLAQARGAMIAAISRTHKGRVFEYSPNMVKASVSSYGHSSKEGVKRSLMFLIGKKEFISDDESDALAVSICHAMSTPYSKKYLQPD